MHAKRRQLRRHATLQVRDHLLSCPRQLARHLPRPRCPFQRRLSRGVDVDAGAVESTQLRLQLRESVDQCVGVAAVLALQACQQHQPLLDLLQTFRIVPDALAGPPQLERYVLDMDHRLAQRLGVGAEAGLDAAGVMQVVGDAAQRGGDRLVAGVQRFFALVADEAELLGMALQLAFLLQLGLVTAYQLGIAQLVHLETEQLHALSRRFPARSQLGKPVRCCAKRGVGHRHLGARRTELAELVEELQMGLRLEEQRLLVLTVHVNQSRPQLTQDRRGREVPVHPHAPLSQTG